jgi:hypothetical protein
MQTISINKAPVALFAFNRPDFTSLVFNQIRVYAPPVVFLIQDGARQEVPSDLESTRQVREILENVDWDCQVHRLYAEENMGLMQRFSSALKYVFAKVDQCIILEDDVLPSQNFFWFAEAALDDFREDKRIGMISGYCETRPKQQLLSRHLSRKPKVWGWATWSDRLVGYDPNQNEFANTTPLSSFRKLRNRGFSLQESLTWPIRIRRALKIRTWDYQWAFHVLSNFGYSLASSTNLVSNLGFGATSTNTQLTPPFIKLQIEAGETWPLDRSVPNVSLSLDRMESFRRLGKMISPAGLWVILRKLASH